MTKPKSVPAVKRRALPRRRVALSFKDSVRRTKQAFVQECDINHIMARYKKTGIIDHVRPSAGMFGDFTEVPDFATAQELVIQAEASFMQLPSKVRDRFSNDPGKFLAFFEDPENFKDASVVSEFKKLGLVIDNGTAAVAPAAVNEGVKPS